MTPATALTNQIRAATSFIHCVKCSEEIYGAVPRLKGKGPNRSVCDSCFKANKAKTDSEGHRARRAKLRETKKPYVENKKCSRCKEEKHRSLFHKNANWKDGLSLYCVLCQKIKSHEQFLIHREKMRRRCAAYRAKKAGAEGSHTAADLEKMKKDQGGVCNTCKKPPEKWHADHIVALSKGGSDWIENIQMLCLSCNVKKSNKTNEEFLRQLEEEA